MKPICLIYPIENDLGAMFKKEESLVYGDRLLKPKELRPVRRMR